MDDITYILQNYKEFRRKYNTCSEMLLWSYQPIDKHSLLVSCHPTENSIERKRLIAYYFGSSGRGSTEKPKSLPKVKDFFIFRYENTFLVPSKFCTGLVTVPHNQVHYVKALKGSVHIFANPGQLIQDATESIVESSYLQTFDCQKSTGKDEDCKAYAAGVQYLIMTTERSLFYYKIVRYDDEITVKSEELDNMDQDVKPEQDMLCSLIAESIMNPSDDDLPVVENTFPLDENMFNTCDSQPDLLQKIIEETIHQQPQELSTQQQDEANEQLSATQPSDDEPMSNVLQQSDEPLPTTQHDVCDEVNIQQTSIQQVQQNEPPPTQHVQQNEPPPHFQQNELPTQHFQQPPPLPDQGNVPSDPLVPVTFVPITYYIPMYVIPQLIIPTFENLQPLYHQQPTLQQQQQTLNHH